MTISANFPNVQPSLLLDFANAKQLPPSVTFTRATTATYYNGSTTALAEQNFFTYSQDFGNAIWTTDGATKTSTTQTDPAGGSTALLLTKVSDNGYSLRQYSAGPSPDSKSFTFSIYLKGASAGNIRLYVDNGVNQSFVSDISITTSWVRYSFTTGTFNSTVSSLTAGLSFQAGSVSSVYAAFAQIEQRSSATAYTATTTQAITNYIPVLLTAGGGQPRFDHNPTTSESLGLLIEEQRTNLISYSGDISNNLWSKSNTTVTGNTIIAPDGTLTGSKIILDAGATGYVGQSIGVSSGSVVYTVYFKAGQYRRVSLWEGAVTAANATFDLISGTIVGQNGATALMTSVGNGWYRCSMISTQTAGARFWLISPVGDTSTTPFVPATTGNGFNGVYAWGGQLEQAAFPTSYIPTTSAAATRAADFASMTGGNFSSWFNNGQGTFYSEVSFPAPAYNSSNTYHFEVSDGTASNRLIGYTGGSQAQMFVSVGGTTQAAIASTSPPAINTSYRCAFLYEVNNFALSVNAQTPVTDTSGTVPPANKLNIAANYAASEPLNGWMKKLAYYPQAVTSAQLQALTS